MSALGEKYTDRQRDAVVAAYAESANSAKRVAELAAAGELADELGTLPAFELPASTVRDLKRKARRGRQATAAAGLEDAPPRDAIETLRRRLVNVADAELAAIERQPEGERDLERLRQATRLVKEAQAIRGPTEPVPPAPGRQQDGVREGGATRGGLAGKLLEAHRASPSATAPAPVQPVEAPPPTASAPVPTESRDERTRRELREAMERDLAPMRAQADAEADLTDREQALARRRASLMVSAGGTFSRLGGRQSEQESERVTRQLDELDSGRARRRRPEIDEDAVTW